MSQVKTGALPSGLGDRAEMVEDIQDLVRQITTKYDRRYFAQCVDDHRQPVELLEAFEQADLLGLNLPAEWGGTGESGVLSEVAMIEAVAAAGIPAFMWINTNLSRVPVYRYGRGEAAERFVRATLRAERRPCFAITEPDSGTNAFRMSTTATPDGDSWRVSGQKIYISGAEFAEQVLLVARTSGEAERGAPARFTLLLVDMASPGVSYQVQGMNVAAPDTQCVVYFDDVRVPGDAVVGEPGRGAEALFSALNTERIMVAAMATGLGNHVLEQGAGFACTRSPFGEPIGRYQSIAHPMARSKAQLDAARVLTYESALAFDAGGNPATAASMAKLIATEGAWAAMDAVVQAHGGAAFEHETGLMYLMQFLRLLRIAPLNNEMVLNQIAERALGLPRSYGWS